MTEAEIMEKLTQKRSVLEQYRSSNTASAAQVKTVEDEIRELETSLTTTQAEPKRKRRTAFLDECAG